MGVGYLLLYAAFVVVALWLVAELLLQHKAPVVWRAVALVGFLGVVAGMRLGSVAVIGLGAAGFAVGQTYVTLSVKRGFEAGWSLRRPDGSLPGALARVPLLAGAVGDEPGDRAGGRPPAEPVGEVGPVEPVAERPGPYAVPQPPAKEPAEPVQQVYAMQPLHEEDSEGYGAYAQATAQGYDSSYGVYQQQGYQQRDPYAAAYQGGYDQTQYATGQGQVESQAPAQQQGYDQAAYGAYQQQGYPQQGYQQQDPYAAAYQGGYDQTQYTAGYDPQQQAAPGDWSQQQPYAEYGGQPYADQQQYGDQQQYADQPYAEQQQPGSWQPSA